MLTQPFHPRHIDCAHARPPLRRGCGSAHPFVLHSGSYERYDALVKLLSAQHAPKPQKKKRKSLTADTAPPAVASPRAAAHTPGRPSPKPETRTAEPSPADACASPKKRAKRVAADADASTPTPKKKAKGAVDAADAAARTPTAGSESNAKKSKRPIAQSDEAQAATPKRSGGGGAAAQKMYGRIRRGRTRGGGRGGAAAVASFVRLSSIRGARGVHQAWPARGVAHSRLRSGGSVRRRT